MPWKKTFLVAQPVQQVALTSPVACLPNGDQLVAAIANDESLQARVRKGTPPPKGGQISTLWHAKVPKPN